MTMVSIKNNWNDKMNTILRSRGLEDPVAVMFCKIITDYIGTCKTLNRIPYTAEYNDFVESLFDTCINYEMPEI